MKKTFSSRCAFACALLVACGVLYETATGCNNANAQDLALESDSLCADSAKVDTIFSGEEYDYFTLEDSRGFIHGYRIQLGVEGDTLKCSEELYEVVQDYHNKSIPQQELHVKLDQDRDSLILVDAPQEVLTIKGHKHSLVVISCCSRCESMEQ